MIYDLDDIGHRVIIPDKELENLQKKLGITQAEAVECWLEDNDLIELDEESLSLVEKTKGIRVNHGTVNKKSDTPKKPRTYIASDEKKALFDTVWQAVTSTYDAKIDKPNKLIKLTINGLEFDINVVEHTKGKKKKEG